MSTSTTIIDCSVYSENFPELKPDYLIRKNYLREIKEKLKINDVVFVDGKEGAGVSTVLAQFAKNENNVITVFFNPLSSLDYRNDFFFRNVSDQIRHLLGEDIQNINNDFSVRGSHSLYSEKIAEICLKLKVKNKQLTLIIDGLNEIISTNEIFVHEILSNIPFKKNPLKVIIVGNQKTFEDISRVLRRIESSSITLSSFSELEILKYLDLDNDIYIDHIYDLTEGLPGRLRNFKRKLEKFSFEDLKEFDNYRDLIEDDCLNIDFSNNKLMTILSLLSLYNKKYSKSLICEITEISNEDIDNIVASCHLLKETNGELRFISNSHREWFSNKLIARKVDIENLMINHLVKNPEVETIGELPSLYFQRGMWGEVISIVNNTKSLNKVLEMTGSLKNVTDYMDQGIKASVNEKSHSDLWRFVIQGSIINELDNYLFWESEIEARAALKDYSGAIRQANTAILSVDRLNLLLLIAKLQQESNSMVDKDLEESIRQLYLQVDLINIGEKIYDVVSNLIYALPNLAIELLESDMNNDKSESDDNINDWIASKVSLQALESESKNDSNGIMKDRLNALQKLGGNAAKKMNLAIRFLVENYDGKKVISEVQKLSDSQERIKLLRLWLLNYNGTEDISNVIEFGINELINSGSNSFNIKDFADLTKNLPYVNDLETRKKLYYRFKTLERDFTNSTLTRNKYRYRLNIFQTRLTFDKKGARRSLNSIISEADSITDYLVKLDVYGEIYASIFKSIEKEFLSVEINIVYTRIFDLVSIVYNKTSYQLEISQNIISTLGVINPEMILEIIRIMNNSDNREASLIELMESYLSNPIKELNWSNLENILSVSKNEMVRHNLIELLIERFGREKTAISDDIIIKLITYFDEVDSFYGTSRRSYNFVQIIKIINLNDNFKIKLANRYESRLLENWEQIDSEWNRSDIGFIICSELASIRRDLSEKIFKKSIAIRENSWIDSPNFANVYKCCVRIVIQSYTSIVNVSQELPSDLNVIKKMIERIASVEYRLNLWAECCFGLIDIGKKDLFSRIMDQFIIPELNLLIEKKNDDIGMKLIGVYTLLTFHNPVLINYYEKIFGPNGIELESYRCCLYILTKKNPFKVYESSSNFVEDFGSLAQSHEQLKKINKDSRYYICLKNICDAISRAFDQKQITLVQLNSLLDQLQELTQNKLPDLQNVRHNGYLILCSARILAAYKRRENTKSEWEDLISKAKDIPNLSDKILVFGEMVEVIPASKYGLDQTRKNLIEDTLECLKILKENNIKYEYIHRVWDLTDVFYKIVSKDWKLILENLFRDQEHDKNNRDIQDVHEELINTVHRFDPEFAKRLIDQLNSEGGNRNLNNRLQRNYKTLEMAKKIGDNAVVEAIETGNKIVFLRAVKDSLKSLNSGKIIGKKLNEMYSILPNASKTPLQLSMPIFNFYLTNCQIVYRTNKLTGAVEKIHRTNFEKAIEATSISEILLHHKRSQNQGFVSSFGKTDYTNTVIYPGERKDVLDFLRDWFEKNLTGSYVIIADPYFDKNSLDIVKLILETNQTIEVKILGNKDSVNQNIEEELLEKWSELSNQPPPKTTITYCWLPDDQNKSPFHDRHILTETSGLRFGTSTNSMGVNKVSEISILDGGESDVIRDTILPDFIEMKLRSMQGLRIKYRSFSF